mgnify:CR=1 FL=1
MFALRLPMRFWVFGFLREAFALGFELFLFLPLLRVFVLSIFSMCCWANYFYSKVANFLVNYVHWSFTMLTFVMLLEIEVPLPLFTGLTLTIRGAFSLLLVSFLINSRLLCRFCTWIEDGQIFYPFVFQCSIYLKWSRKLYSNSSSSLDAHLCEHGLESHGMQCAVMTLWRRGTFGYLWILYSQETDATHHVFIVFLNSLYHWTTPNVILN